MVVAVARKKKKHVGTSTTLSDQTALCSFLGFQMENEHNKAFKQLRHTLCAPPILVLFHFESSPQGVVMRPSPTRLSGAATMRQNSAAQSEVFAVLATKDTPDITW